MSLPLFLVRLGFLVQQQGAEARVPGSAAAICSHSLDPGEFPGVIEEFISLVLWHHVTSGSQPQGYRWPQLSLKSSQAEWSSQQNFFPLLGCGEVAQ